VVVPQLRRLIRMPTSDAVAAGLLGTAAMAVGMFDLAAGFLADSQTIFRGQRRVGRLTPILADQSILAALVGLPDAATVVARETCLIGTAIGLVRSVATAHTADAIALGFRGQSAEAAAIWDDNERAMLLLGAKSNLSFIQLGRGVAALGSGEYADAYRQLRRLFDRDDLASHYAIRGWAAADLAEAAAHCGEQDEARRMLSELGTAIAAPGSFSGLALVYAQALLSDDEDAESMYATALGADLGRWPFLRARIQLSFGTWLRRQRRTAEARPWLSTAEHAFGVLSAGIWAARAHHELRATGDRGTRLQAKGSRTALTPQEGQVARLAAQGLSNREIAEQLYLSHRTVGYHLHRIYPKLGVTSRTKLPAALVAISE
jgi:DNA-binding CsgD family transcriptional regulator